MKKKKPTKKTKKMPPKNSKITDVSSPGKTTPSATARPLLVTNRPVLADPMIVDEAKSNAISVAGEPGASAVTRTAKTIAPVSADMQAPATEASPETPASAAEASVAAPDEPKPTASETANETDTAADESSVPSSEAANAEALAAEEARQQQLEQLIAGGEFAVPINAVQRKRSRMFVVALCLLAVVLAVALLDAALDAGILKLSVNIPHTHLLSAN